VSETTRSALRSVAPRSGEIDAACQDPCQDPRIEGGVSVDAARRRLARQFRCGGLDAPELDARLLVGHALGIDHAALAAQSSRALTAEEADVLAALAQRRRGWGREGRAR
jgi:hypothetical protein